MSISKNPVDSKILLLTVISAVSISLAAVSLGFVFVLSGEIDNLQSKNHMENVSKNQSSIMDMHKEDNVGVEQGLHMPMGASEIYSDCGEDGHCLVHHLKSASESMNQDEFLAITSEIITALEQDNFYCHDDAHHIGNFLYEYFDGNIVAALANTDHRCGNALIHGVVENHLPDQINSQNIALENLDITTVCDEIGGNDKSYLGMQCVHGIGHSLTTVYDFDVIEAVLRCDEFQTKREQTMCSDGVFMENSIEEYNTGGGNFDENNMFYPCNQVVQRYHEKCFVYQGSQILERNNYSPEPAIQVCKVLPSNDERWCIFGVINHMTIINFYEVDKTAALCKGMKNLDYQEMCIDLAISNIVLYVDPELGDDFCSEFSHEQKKMCLEDWAETKKIHYNT